MKFKPVSLVLVLFIFFSFIAIVYLKFQQYKLQISIIQKQLDNSQGNNQTFSRDLKTLQAKYSACINDQIIKVGPWKNFKFEEIDINAPLLATQSGSFDIFDYKGTTQTNYNGNLPPYNDFRINVFFHKTKLPYLFSDCKDSPIDHSSTVCSVRKLDLSEFSFKGITKKGFPYYQKTGIAYNQENKTEYTTIIQLPLIEKKENRTVIITYIGKVTDQDYQQYLSLIHEIDTKVY